MAKVLDEYSYSNSIVLADSYRGIDTYKVNGIKMLGYLTSSDGNWYIDAGERKDLIDASLTLGSNTLLGGNGNDTIYGGWGNDLINGGADSDIVQAGPGNDTVIYDPADLYVSGGSGIDTIDAGSVASVKGKGVTIELSSTRDVYVDFENIIGSAFADTLRGDNGANYITGGAGIDKMYGGAGDDSFIIEAANHHGSGEIIDGNAGYDVIRFTSTTEGDTLTLSAKVNVEEARVGDSAGSSSGVTEANIDASNVASTVGIALYGNDGNNHLTGNGAANRIQGGAGDDVIDGGAGDDDLTGGGNADIFVWSAGNDTIQDFEVVKPGVLLDFEGITDELATLLVDYKGLTWLAPYYGGVYAVDPDAMGYPPNGFTTVLTSDTCVAYSWFNGGFSSPDENSDFDFVSGYFASEFTYFDSDVTVNAYDDGVLVGSVALGMRGGVKAEVEFLGLEPVATGVNYAHFSGGFARFASVDRIEFVPNSGRLAMDDLVLQMDDAAQTYDSLDKIDVPDGWDIAELVASATSDGSGGTILTHDEGSVTLVGIDPTTVSADWFV